MWLDLHQLVHKKTKAINKECKRSSTKTLHLLAHAVKSCCPHWATYLFPAGLVKCLLWRQGDKRNPTKSLRPISARRQHTNLKLWNKGVWSTQSISLARLLSWLVLNFLFSAGFCASRQYAMQSRKESSYSWLRNRIKIIFGWYWMLWKADS